MQLNEDFIKIIFGIRIKKIRTHKGLSLADLAKKSGLSSSYLNEIENGKKYPKTEKIIALANALEKPYEELVSLELTKSLSPIKKLLGTNFLDVLPEDLFGLDYQKMIEFVVNEPVKSNALISTIIEIARNYELTRDEFYYATLRSYQELNDNYFEDIENATGQLRKKLGIQNKNRIAAKEMYEVLTKQFNVKIEEKEFGQQKELAFLRYAYSKSKNTLYINTLLTESQRAYVFSKEIGYRVLDIRPRPGISPLQNIQSFEEVYNNFQSSYFASAFLINKESLITDTKRMIVQKEWKNDLLLKIMDKYTSSPELFMHRFTSILPTYFNLKDLFFLRFDNKMGSPNYTLTKELHLSKLHNPHGNGLHEHYCRRWISLKVLKDMEYSRTRLNTERPISAAQISNYEGSDNQYFVISLARPKIRTPKINTSLTIGFLLNDAAKRKVRFWNDTNIAREVVNETCERCAISDCKVRASKPTIVKREKQKAKVISMITELLD